jgi:hypothetical protein
LAEGDESVEQLCWATGSHSIAGGGLGPDERIGLVVGGQGKGGIFNGQQQQSTAFSSKSTSSRLRQQQHHLSHEMHNPTSTVPEEQEPLALLVVHAAMHMLFLPQFTCDFYEDTSHSNKNKKHDMKGNTLTSSVVMSKGITAPFSETKEDKELKAEAGLRDKNVEWGVSLIPHPTSIVWSPGAGVSAAQTSADAMSRKYDKNRIELLRLLLTTCCDPLFSPADEYNPLASRWMAVATAADAPNAVCLFYSLLNTILGYDPRSASGFGSDFGTHVKLVELSVQMLCVLTDCGLPGNPEPVIDKYGHPCVEYEEASKGGFNIFRLLMARITVGKDLTFCYDGFVRLLRNVYEQESSAYNPMTGSGQKLACYQELLVLFWKFLEENPLFLNHVLLRCNVNDVLVPICFLMYKSRRDPAQIGLVHICTFVLLKLSGERSFGVVLNKKYNKKLPTDLPLFHGCHADLLAIVLHKLVVNGAYKLVPLYSCFLTIIANISPYWKSMSLVAAVKLVSLFELFSSPKFLYSGEQAYRHLALLFEIFNNIIQYQYHGNAHLVYAIVRRKDAFGQLVALTLEHAQAQCHKVYGEHSTVKRDIDNAPPSQNGLSTMMSRAAGIIDRHGGMVDQHPDDISRTSSIHGAPFQPTQEWLHELKASLPMETVTRLLQHLVPVVDDIVSKKQGVVDEQEILDVLNEITMVGLLPVPHPIVIRKYQPNQYTALWFTAFMWGVIFIRNQSLPLFDGHCIELFQVSVEHLEE